ncbi:hypothetical protein [Sphingobium boeckii]|uniref:Uncharacterized protein n=1 Tax=Sphingobium boeckii TaxID=1082345 RepID=A0A7W9ALD7_9SPHN|nr:hypothetical protein [Sphingobium boeckii]MBB5687824.1 hypothetical protein [Sphingobium boeckii]
MSKTPSSFRTDVDAAREEQVLDMPQRQRKQYYIIGRPAERKRFAEIIERLIKCCHLSDLGVRH